jgi:Family of unknown function (DUF6173)
MNGAPASEITCERKINAMSDNFLKPPPLMGVSVPDYLMQPPQFSLPEMPLLLKNPLVEQAEANLASEFYSRLTKWIEQFDQGLDSEHEVGVRLVSFGQAVTFHLSDMSYWNPSLISFSGKTDNGDPVELIQHVSQISILLTRLKRPNPEQPKRPIGFAATGE